MDVQSIWAYLVSLFQGTYGFIIDNNWAVWATILLLVALYALNIPGRLRTRASAPQHTFGEKREEELRKQQEEVRKRQYEHFSEKLKEDAEKRAEEKKKESEERAKHLRETGDTTDSKPRALPSKNSGSGGGGFSHMNSAGPSRSVVRRVQPRQS